MCLPMHLSSPLSAVDVLKLRKKILYPFSDGFSDGVHHMEEVDNIDISTIPHDSAQGHHPGGIAHNEPNLHHKTSGKRMKLS